ncbi:MAG: hypothetical protein HKN91_17825 [Acidimicrobiia bacterium]|nr:hypothetical protein [Acidimicrobiia bacterium]
MRDVTDQLVAYAEILDGAAPPLEELSATEKPDRRRSLGFQIQGVWALVAGAVAVLVVVGGIAALSRRTTTIAPPVDSTTATTTFPVPEVSIDLLNPRAVTPTTFEWEHAFAGPGGLELVDGTFHMLSATYGDGVATVGYAKSTDGLVWVPGVERPVLDLSSAPWAPLEFDHALPRSLVLDADGVWHLYFEIAWVDDFFEESFFVRIGHASTRDPGGLWVFDNDPALAANSDVAWMAKRVGSPSVIFEDGEFVMLFVGYGEGGGVVGRATSPDGASWTVDDAPVLEPQSDWERGEIVRVDFVRIEGGYATVFAGDTTSRRGLAVSRDGITWFPHPENPIMTTSDLPRASVFDSEFIANESGLLGFVENGGVRSEREVVVLQVDVDLVQLLEALAGN